MSDCDFLDYTMCASSPLTGEDSPIGQSFEPLPNPFESHWPSGAESVGSTSNNDFSLGLNTLDPERRRSPSQPPLGEPTVWTEDLIGLSYFWSPLPSEVIPDVPKHFDGQIPVEDTYSAERTGKVPNVNIFAPEDDDFDAVTCSNPKDDDAEIPSTPVQRQVVVPLPKPGKRLFSRSSSITSSEASYYMESPLRSRTAAQKEVNSNRTVRIKAPKAAVVLDEPKDEPPAKKSKGRKTFNSACAADNLASFAPVHNANLTPSAVASSPIGSPLTSLSDSSDTSSPLPKATTTKKRKLEEIDKKEDPEFTTVKQGRKSQPVNSEWEPVNESYSRRTIQDKFQYRCTLCFKKDGHVHLCSREGDMKRHMETAQHKAKSHFCLNSGCSRSFTREDAVKRHMAKCRL